MPVVIDRSKLFTIPDRALAPVRPACVSASLIVHLSAGSRRRVGRGRRRRRVEFDDGSPAVRFCYYDHVKRSLRSPLVVSNGDMVGPRRTVAGARRLRSPLSGMVG